MYNELLLLVLSSFLFIFWGAFRINKMVSELEQIRKILCAI